MSTLLDRLYAVLSKAEISDGQIIGGLKLTRRGMQSLAGQLGISATSVPPMLDALAIRLSDENARDVPISESAQGDLTYEGPDFLGNVTIRDRDTGYEVFLTGTKASELMNALDGRKGDEQSILRGYFSLNETEEADFSVEDIKRGDGGSYNFVYDIGSLKGTGTARFSGAGKNFTVKVISVRDKSGSEITPTSAQAQKIHDAAVEFIGQE